MEATEDKGRGLLHQLLPPRLEDAGLEDCALPPDAIKEAFLKAATAVKSRAASILTANTDDDADSCVKDPWADAEGHSDVVAVGGSVEAREPDRPCAAVKGGGVREVSGGDDLVVFGGGEEDEGGKDCVDGLKGLEIGGKEKKDYDRDGDSDEEEEKVPTLVGGYV